MCGILFTHMHLYVSKCACVCYRRRCFEWQVLGSDFREHPRSLELPVGADAVLDCRPPKGEPEPRVRWRKDNDPVKTGDRWTITDTGSLRIRDVRREDSGVYVCNAYNIGGDKDSNPARLLVRGVLINYWVTYLKGVSINYCDICLKINLMTHDKSLQYFSDWLQHLLTPYNEVFYASSCMI